MKLRITGGILSGRLIDSPGTATTHPMGERVRLALFNTLGDIAGKSLLDPFAGSGTVSLEALSRGAAQATAIEQDRAALSIIQQNSRLLGLESQIQIVPGTCLNWMQQHPKTTFDLIVCDPPYDNLQLPTIAQLAKHLQASGWLVLSHPAHRALPQIAHLKLVKQSRKHYGGAQLAYYQLANS